MPTFQWRQCDAVGANCNDISGATSSTYTVPAGFNASLRVVVDGVTSNPWYPTTPPAAVNLGTALPARMPDPSLTKNPGDANTTTVTTLGGLNTAWAAASAGDVIYVRTGSYSRWIPTHRQFSSSNPVTVMGYPGETATFVGNSTEPGQGTDLVDIGGLRLKDLTFAARLQTSVKLTNCQNIELYNCLIRDSGRDMTCRGSLASGTPSCGWGIGISVVGLPISGFTYSKSANVQIYNCTFTNNGGYTTGNAGDIKHGHALYLGGANNVSNGGCDSFVVANCLAFDSPNGNAFQFGESAVNGFIVNNTIDNTDTRSLTGTSKSTDASGSAFDIWDNGSTPHPGNIKIVNNIFSNNTGPAGFSSTTHNLVGNVVDTNLVWNNAQLADWTTSTWYRLSAFGGTAYDVPINEVIADPGFKNRSGTFGSTSKDYTLRTDSAALGKGRPEYCPPFDARGHGRPAAPALGPFET